VKPTSDEFEPRRDGWFEHDGIWGEVTIGTVIGGRKRSQRWEIVDQQQVGQTEFGVTLWMRAREQSTGEEFTVKPRTKTSRVTILTQDPADTETPARTPASTGAAIELLVKKLGATHLATRNEVTGEITCPDYTDLYGAENQEVEHLRFAHGLSVDDGISAKDLAVLHGQAHNPKWPNIGKGGFPHRHVPEDLTVFTGRRRNPQEAS
jgi:hypothetical protein